MQVSRHHILRKHQHSSSLLLKLRRTARQSRHWQWKVVANIYKRSNSRALIKCMDSSGCTELFPDSEMKRFLDEKSFEGLSKLRTEEELRQANLEGIVHCPFCPFAAIMEDPTDRIFECLNPDCGVRSCRYCHVKSHHPLSCESTPFSFKVDVEFQKEKKIDAKHTVEEAMTAALVKKCNKCGKAFLKEDGCNKIVCPCGNLQCYICSENVTTYDHFGYGRCPQYDDTVKRQRREVAKAQGRAVKDVLKETTDLTVEDVTVDEDLMGVVKLKVKKKKTVEFQEPEHELGGQELERLIHEEEVRQQVEVAENRRRLRQMSLQHWPPLRQPQVIPHGTWPSNHNEGRMVAAIREIERHEEHEALRAVRNFEMWERQVQQQLEAEAAWAAAEKLRAMRDTQVWDAFVQKSQSLYRPLEEEYEVQRNGTPERIEMYWGMRTQNLIVFISEAKEMVAEYDERIKGQKWTEVDRHRHERAKSFLILAERELAQFREDAVIRKKHGLARTKSFPVESKKVNMRFFRRLGRD